MWNHPSLATSWPFDRKDSAEKDNCRNLNLSLAKEVSHKKRLFFNRLTRTSNRLSFEDSSPLHKHAFNIFENKNSLRSFGFRHSLRAVNVSSVNI